MAVQASVTKERSIWGNDGQDGSWLLPRHDAARPGIQLLEADPDLGRRLDPAVRDRLSSMLRVRVETFSIGDWQPNHMPLEGDAFGLLLLDGLLLREMDVNGRICAELLGPGDLLRPWPQADELDSMVSTESAWHVIDGPVRVAVLDRRASVVIGRFPGLVSELLDRGVARARGLQFQLALTQVHGIDHRLVLLLQHLAERWGRVTLDGIVVPLHITHEMLGRLIGARRPSVTTALRSLSDSGLVRRHSDGWVLAPGGLATH